MVKSERKTESQKSVHDTVVEAMLNIWIQKKERHYLSVTGSSMLPLIRNGDSVLITHGCDGVRRGDVVVFRCNGKLIAHRVLRKEIDKEKKSVTYIMKGDNVFQFDPPVRGNEIIGRVLSIRKGGRQIWLDTPIWRILGLTIAAGTLTVSTLGSCCRNLMRKVPGFGSGYDKERDFYRVTLCRYARQIYKSTFFCIRKIVFFIFCGLR